MLLPLFMLGACKKQTQSIDLTFKLTYENEPLVMLNEYTFPTGETIKFTRFSFYVSDVNATTDGQSSEIEDVNFLNLTASHSTLDDAQLGYTYTLDEIPAGDIESIDLTLGVNPQLNQQVPSDFTGDHPLAKPGEYWIAWDSFIFFKIEGIVDLDGDGETETNVALHIGSDQAAREISISVTEENAVDITIDVMSIFNNGSTTFDLQNNPQIHSLSQIDLANFLMDNFSKAFL